MKSIDKLRKTLKDCTTKTGIEPNKFDTYWITAAACDRLIDEIEAEIERDYIKLEDVLRKYACDFADSTGPDYDEEITRKCADEIRELFAVMQNEKEA